MAGGTLLAMRGISKAFPGVRALHSVDFDLARGEIHGLIGENGAGKSTLIKILGGAYLPDGGSIELDGQAARIHSPRDALHKGISIIYQEFNLVPALSVAQNIFLGRELVSRGGLNQRAMLKRAQQTMERLGLSGFDCRRRVRSLSVAQQQMVEIAKAMFNEARILVMDEPTSVLSQKESETLFGLMRGLRDQGLSIIFISHRLDEVIELCSRITVLRDGELVSTLENSGGRLTKDELVRQMVGRVLQDYYPQAAHRVGERTLLEVRGLSAGGLFREVSFELHDGEILGFYGLVGSGRTEIMKALFGSLEYDGGEILVAGRPNRARNVRQARDAGLALVPEDRKREGLVVAMSLADNIALPNLDKINSLGTILFRRRRGLVAGYIEELSIRPPLPNRQMRDFSGGNQQKAVIAKWLAAKPKIMIFDEPTRGIDVGAKAEIYHLIERLAQTGVGIIFVSSELMEIIGMCDRVIVVHEGRITGRFDRSDATQERLMQAAAGF
ncbi:MAG: hypothetical protein A2V99_17505 [Spirochaetes bacterium RBG_16_67_19]|nr:MAG: hypothetical protein A2V99_17505 [Spirochaetes bacterium RBG_16_67_19]